MGELQSALDALAAEDLHELGDGPLPGRIPRSGEPGSLPRLPS
jgi:hypothetical protein